MRATLLLVLWAVFPAQARAQDVPAGSPEDARIYAQRHFERGRTAYKTQDFEEALVAFQSSLQLFSSPNARLYLARTFGALDRVVEAANTYEEVIRAARLKEDDEPSYRNARTSAENELRTLQPRLARLTVSVTSAQGVSSVAVNERVIPKKAYGLPIYVRPGKVLVRTVYVDGSTKEEEVRLEAQARKEIVVGKSDREVSSQASDPQEVESPTAALEAAGGDVGDEEETSLATVGLGVGVGVAVLGWGSAVVFGLLADSRYEQLNMECGSSCAATKDADIDGGRRYQTLANTGLVVGAVGTVAVGVALMFLLGTDDGERGTERVALAPGGIRVRW